MDSFRVPLFLLQNFWFFKFHFFFNSRQDFWYFLKFYYFLFQDFLFFTSSIIFYSMTFVSSSSIIFFNPGLNSLRSIIFLFWDFWFFAYTTVDCFCKWIPSQIFSINVALCPVSPQPCPPWCYIHIPKYQIWIHVFTQYFFCFLKDFEICLL